MLARPGTTSRAEPPRIPWGNVWKFQRTSEFKSCLMVQPMSYQSGLIIYFIITTRGEILLRSSNHGMNGKRQSLSPPKCQRLSPRLAGLIHCFLFFSISLYIIKAYSVRESSIIIPYHPYQSRIFWAHTFLKQIYIYMEWHRLNNTSHLKWLMIRQQCLIKYSQY